MMTGQNTDQNVPLVCARCGKSLRPGSGNYYQVTIEAIADPAPSQFSPEDLIHDLRQKIERLLKQMQDVSEQEAMAQVYLRRQLLLCVPCCRRWIEQPVA
ncbi:MAG TPA: hypothetical protein VH592_25735 [Gemmataceae bacterium]|jgi:hypothetical protein